MQHKTRFLASIFLMLLFSTPGWADDSLKIVGPAESDPGDLVVLDASESSINNAAPQKYIWKLINSTKTFMPMEGGSKVVFSSGTPGEYRFLLIGVSVKGKEPIVLDKEVTIKIKGVVPSPDPKPPGPGPQPGPGPVSDKLSIVVIRDFQQIVPQSQLSAFNSQETRDYLKSVAPITLDSGYRLLDYRTPTVGEAPFIQQALAKPRDSLPWIVITGPKGSYSGKAPTSFTELKALVEKYR